MVEFLNNKISGFRQFSEMKDKAAPSKGLGFLGWTLLFLCAYWLFLSPKKTEVQDKPVEIEQLDISDVPRQTLADNKIAATVQGLRISNINLTGYKAAKDEEDNIELLSDEKEFIEIGFLGSGTNMPQANTIWKPGTHKHMADATMSWKSNSGVDFFRQVLLENKEGEYDYIIKVFDDVSNKSSKPVFISQYSRIVRGIGEKSRFAVKTGGIAYINGDMETENWNDIADRAKIYQASGGQPVFAGFSDQYWETIISPLPPENPESNMPATDKTIKLRQRGDQMFQAEIAPEFAKIEPGQKARFVSYIFAGPKTQAALNAAGTQIRGIDRTLDYGWFGFLSRPFLWTLNKIHDIVPNYGIAIIFLTLIIRALMWPLTKKSFKAMAAMQKIQPEMQRIQKLYADDKMRMQQEIMRLYRTQQANPLGAIGMMFLQIPIFFALYKALLIAVPLRHAGFLWLNDLSVMDPYFILPVIMAATMWIQNRLSSAGKNTAPGMQFMKYMPFIFAGIFAFMPSGLVLYWTVSNIVGIFQLWIMKRGTKQSLR